MFTKLLNWFSNAWDVFLEVLQGSWDYIKQSWFWLVGVFYAFLLVTEQVVGFVWDSIVELFSLLSSLIIDDPNTIGLVDSDTLVIINTFFPLSEFFVLITSLSVVLMTGIAYRFVKSWIPTVN